LNCVARGTAYLAAERQYLYGAPLKVDCFKVLIEQAIKENASLPYPNVGQTVVWEALHCFVAWPKQLIKFTDKVSLLFYYTY
jgi:hypothetical protein